MAKVPIWSDFQQQNINEAFSRNLTKSLAKSQVSSVQNLLENGADLFILY